MLLIKCCKKCIPPKRHKNCHASCKEYKEEKEEINKRNQAIKEAKDKDNVIFGYVHDRNCKLKRFNEVQKK